MTICYTLCFMRYESISFIIYSANSCLNSAACVVSGKYYVGRYSISFTTGSGSSSGNNCPSPVTTNANTGLAIGAIIGIVVGAIIILLIFLCVWYFIGFVVYYCRRLLLWRCYWFLFVWKQKCYCLCCTWAKSYRC